MSTFWSNWIIVLTVISYIAIVWLIFVNRKTQHRKPDSPTTGHEHDGIKEYDNPMPAWWIYLFIITLIYGAGYLIAYPGLGNFPGLLGWTQEGQWEEQMAQAEAQHGALFASYGATPVAELINDPQALKMGQRLFANNCAQCHGSDGRGSLGFPNLTNQHWLYGGSPEAISTSITEGRTGIMPSWGAILNEQQLNEVTDYVMSLSDKGEQTTADLNAGEQVYKTYCVACHGVDGTGNVLLGAPDLTAGIYLYGSSRGAIKQTISVGRTGVMPAQKNLLSADKIHLLTAYVYSLSHPSTQP